MDKVLRARGKSLETSFFSAMSEDLRVEAERAARREALAEALKIDNPAVLDQLMKLELGTEEVVAFSLVPLVAVAWADFEIQKREREAIMAAAADYGVAPGSVAGRLLEEWLTQRPGRDLLEAWIAYARQLASDVDEAAKAELREEVIGRARQVAVAAGGFLGLGAKVSDAEQAVLDQLEAALA